MLIPGHFVLKDVVVMQLRPLVLYPPGLEQKPQVSRVCLVNWKLKHLANSEKIHIIET